MVRGKAEKQNAGANLGFEQTLWADADYKYAVLGVIFLKYSTDEQADKLSTVEVQEETTKYTTLAKSLHKRNELNLQEFRTLAALRDALLPKLLSGAVRIQQVEQIQQVES